MSNIEATKDGLVEKSTGRKIKSPLDMVIKAKKFILKLEPIIMNGKVVFSQESIKESMTLLNQLKTQI